MFVLVGVNNISRGNYENTIREQYELLLEELDTMNLDEIYIQSIMPVRYPSTVSNERIVKANQIIKELAEQYNCVFIDTYSVMVNDEGELIEDYNKDGIHINSDGYEKWANLLSNYIE